MPDSRFQRRPGLVAALAASLMIVTGLAACGGDDGPPTVTIKTVSTRADMVSGGDALVEIALPANTSAAGLKVDVDGTDVSQAFAVRADGRITGVVTGLKAGDNTVSAS